jgi:CRISPR/Cas system CMR-associated protein Cmr5 small subunit
MAQTQQQLLSTVSPFAPAMTILVTKTSPEYRAITEECLALIRWIRHFASALNKTE